MKKNILVVTKTYVSVRGGISVFSWSRVPFGPLLSLFLILVLFDIFSFK